jgi:hypothetical protein
MAGHSTQNTEHLIRSQLWSAQLKKVLEDELIGTKYVRFFTDFPDGDTLNIPSIGQAEVHDYVEGNAVKYSSLDTGNFQFQIKEYKQTGTYITNKLRQDSFYAAQLDAAFVPTQARALAVAMETDVLATGPNSQTPGNANAINGANHRWVGSGTNETMDIIDFQKARFALWKANVPLVNLVAIVDPSVEYALSTQANILNIMTPQPVWGRIANEGGLSGMQFKYNIFGFDVYVSNYLPSNLSETVGSKTASAGVANLLFSAAPEVLPFVGLIRQPPTVESEYNKDFQREEYITICRYGFDVIRPESLCVVITDTDQITF